MQDLISQNQKQWNDDPTQPLIIPKPEELQTLTKVDEMNSVKK